MKLPRGRLVMAPSGPADACCVLAPDALRPEVTRWEDDVPAPPPPLPPPLLLLVLLWALDVRPDLPTEACEGARDRGGSVDGAAMVKREGGGRRCRVRALNVGRPYAANGRRALADGNERKCTVCGRRLPDRDKDVVVVVVVVDRQRCGRGGATGCANAISTRAWMVIGMGFVPRF